MPYNGSDLRQEIEYTITKDNRLNITATLTSWTDAFDSYATTEGDGIGIAKQFFSVSNKTGYNGYSGSTIKSQILSYDRDFFNAT